MNEFFSAAELFVVRATAFVLLLLGLARLIRWEWKR